MNAKTTQPIKLVRDVGRRGGVHRPTDLLLSGRKAELSGPLEQPSYVVNATGST
jgi:hypothetical protein